MTPQLIQFYTNWLEKADGYEGDSLANHFDRFTSLYVVYNSLYMDVMNELVISGANIPLGFKDKKAASDYVIQYLRGKFFIDSLLNDQISIDNLSEICRILEEEQFHIILHWGNQQRPLDLQLLDKLRSNNKQNKAVAILRLFYHIRCNLFHGHKGFEERQRLLLIPVNALLRKTVQLTFNKLDT
jgi:hypothetical protein